jgi:hypothetical protein
MYIYITNNNAILTIFLFIKPTHFSHELFYSTHSKVFFIDFLIYLFMSLLH